MDIADLQLLAARRETRKLEKIETTLGVLDGLGWAPAFQRITSAATEPTCTIDGREVVMLCSNNYLGLAKHPAVLEGARAALEEHGLGPGGARVLCGNVDLIPDLERRVAALVGAEDAVTFPTGYMANLSVFRTLLHPFLGDLPYAKRAPAVIADEGNHATVFDGITLSHARRYTFAHNDMDDLVAKLEAAGDSQPRMIVTEGVFTLDGEVAPLPEVVAIAERYGAILMIDDAHGVGVMGERGGGTLEHFGLQGRADVVMGSFDKGLGGMGGFLAGRKEVVRFLRMASRPLLFSSAFPAVMAGAMIRAVETCIDEDGLRARLRANADHLRAELVRLGFRVLGNGELPVVPVVIGDEEAALSFSKRIFELGVFAPPFRWPAVPRGTARIRATVTALHQRKHLDRVVDAFRIAAQELGTLEAAA